jgi:hypothetical protein
VQIGIQPTTGEFEMAKAAKAAASTKPMAKDTKAVGFVLANAISADVGEKALANLKGAMETDAEISDLTFQSDKKKYLTLALMTDAFVKAAKADKRIDLGDVLKDGKTWGVLREKLEVVMGVRIINRSEDGAEKITLAPWTKPYLVQTGENKSNCETYQDKDTFRSNFQRQVKNAAGAAHAIVEKGIVAKLDEKIGTLLLSGPAIKKHFGNVEEVALNERKNVDINGKNVTLNNKPSFKEIGNIAKGTGVGTGAGAPGQGAQVTEKSITAHVNSLIASLGKVKNIGDGLAKALEELSEKIEEVLVEREEAA